MFKNIFLAVILSVISPSAWAACSADGVVQMSNEVENSASGTVRSAYRNGTCKITKDWHGGGSPCIAGKGTWHQTVRVGTTTFHVFDYKETYPGYTDKYCTTS